MTKNEQRHESMRQALALALSACEAAIKYDKSIAGAAIRGEVDIHQEIGTAESPNLDALYADWQEKSTRALTFAGVPIP